MSKWNMRIAAAFIAACMIAASAGAQTVLKRIAPIDTTGGLLAGKVLPSGVKAWLGVPFAKPPVDNLRWQRPQPMHWQGVWDADRMMPECIQVLRPHNINHYFGEEATSEDCLYMNIWAPANSHAGSKLPVIVFIYGGGYTIGSSGMPLYGGEPIARDGRAIFVNFNYRVGILGFMAHPELTKEQGGHSGDYGFLDQTAALKWIHENIAKFGGDPGRVLIMGQSAGAGSVVAQMFSPLSKGLFSEAVMSSGCNWDSNPVPLSEGEKIGLEIQQRLGASNLHEMRQVPADKILALQAENQVGAHNAGVRTSPVIDGYFATGTKLGLLQSHAVNAVPIIASFNTQDLDAFSPLVTAKTVADYQAVAKGMFGANAPEFLKMFPVEKASDIRSVGIVAAREMDLEAHARSCAMLQTKYNDLPAYIDMFALVPSFAPGVKIADLDPATAGAYHTADIPFWFGTQDVYVTDKPQPTRAWKPWDRQLSRDMMGALIAFVSTGNPNTASVHWSAWKPDNEQKIVFGKTIHMVKLDTKRMDWLLAHPPAFRRRPPTTTAARPRPHD